MNLHIFTLVKLNDADVNCVTSDFSIALNSKSTHTHNEIPNDIEYISQLS